MQLTEIYGHMCPCPRIREPILILRIRQGRSSQCFWNIIGLIGVVEPMPTMQCIIAPLLADLTDKRSVVGLVLRLVGMVLLWTSTAWLTMNLLVMLEINLGKVTPLRGGKVWSSLVWTYFSLCYFHRVDLRRPLYGQRLHSCTYFLVHGFVTEEQSH